MKSVLLLLPPSVDADAAGIPAIHRARALGARLVAVVILPEDATHHLANQLDEAFVGDVVSDEAVEALRHEQRAQAEELLHAIALHAKAAGIEFTPLVEAGEPGVVCGPIIAAHEVHLVVFAEHHRSWLTRWWAHTTSRGWLADLGCEVEFLEA